MLLEEAFDTFLMESRGLLMEMEAALLQLESEPENDELIGAIFRAAHTIKGTGGVFGFSDVEAFTHVVESSLDLMRSGELKVTSKLTEVLLLCHDHMKILVEIAVDSDSTLTDEDKETGKALMAKLETISGKTKVVSEDSEVDYKLADVEVIDNTAQYVVTDYWHISLRFNTDVLRNGMDPLSFLRYLEKKGKIINVTLIDFALPSWDDMDPELCYLGFEIEFDSTIEKVEIEDVFEFVRDDCTLHILPPRAKISEYAKMIDALPEEDQRLGEILIQSGALSEKERDEALLLQQRKADSSEVEKQPIGNVLVENKMVHQEVVDVALTKQKKGKEKKSAESRLVRVDAEKLDALINLVGELMIAGATTKLLAQQVGEEAMLESISGMGRLVEEIRDNALTLRMVPIGETFNRFQRVVRNIGSDLKKEISLKINGADTELDKTVVEKIGDPLMHLVRNAMDHGIESPEERINSGKPSMATINLNAYHDSGSIVIEIVDDGAGLDRDLILHRAIEKGLITENQLLSDDDVYRLIFEPGFSTAQQVTSLSGRGVGMDVVKRNIEALRGVVEISSTPKVGTKVSIRLPLTLAIIDGFLVRVSESRYVIPLDMVVECVELEDVEKNNAKGKNYIDLRGDVLPFVRLQEMFSEKQSANERENVVVVQYGSLKAGLVVDELLGEYQTVIKPLGKIFKNLKCISGATILGSGDVAVILDVPRLMVDAVGRSSHQQHTHVDQGASRASLH